MIWNRNKTKKLFYFLSFKKRNIKLIHYEENKKNDNNNNNNNVNNNNENNNNNWVHETINYK